MSVRWATQRGKRRGRPGFFFLERRWRGKVLGAAISAAADRLFQKKRAEGEGKKEEAEGKTGNYDFLSV